MKDTVQVLLTMTGPVKPAMDEDHHFMPQFCKYVNTAFPGAIAIVNNKYEDIKLDVHLLDTFVHVDKEKSEPTYYVYSVIAVDNEELTEDQLKVLTYIIQHMFRIANEQEIISSVDNEDGSIVDDDKFNILIWDIQKNMAMQTRYWLNYAVDRNIDIAAVSLWHDNRDNFKNNEEAEVTNPLRTEIMSFVIENRAQFEEKMRRDYEKMLKHGVMSKEDLEKGLKVVLSGTDEWIAMISKDSPTKAVEDLLSKLNIEVK